MYSTSHAMQHETAKHKHNNTAGIFTFSVHVAVQATQSNKMHPDQTFRKICHMLNGSIEKEPKGFQFLFFIPTNTVSE